MSAIPLGEQFFVEKDLNNKYGWLIYGIGLIALVLYGVMNYWVEFLLRKHKKRVPAPAKFWVLINSQFQMFGFTIQPNLVALLLGYCAVNVGFCLAQTKLITYEPWFYIVGKRVGKVAMGNTPLLYLFATKNDVVTLITGMSHHQVNLLHRWMGRVIYLMVLSHLSMTIKYWLSVKFETFLTIPPMIFGMIAFGSMTVLVCFSPRMIRRLSYEFFLFNHGMFAGIMMLMALFHNGGARAHAILAIHTVVLDRVTSYVRAIVNKKLARSDAICTVLDSDGTVEVRIPMGTKTFKGITIGNWKAGQHVYLRIGAVRRVQWHPFTIASTSDTREIRLVIRKQTGFTKALGKKIIEQDQDNAKFKALVHGPYGGIYQPLDTFDSVILFAGGTGGSFVFPVALTAAKQVPTTVYWFCKSKEHLVWYQESIEQLKELGVHVQIHYSEVGDRPTIQSLIPATNNMALLACGPDSLTQDVVFSSQKLKMQGYSIYTYVERYIV